MFFLGLGTGFLVGIMVGVIIWSILDRMPD